MTISSSNRKAGPFTGNGVTVAFPFAFKVFTTADVLVVQAVTATGVETTLVLGTNYTVTLNGDQNANPGGTITMLVAPATGTTLTATSQVGNLQPMDLTNAGGFYPKVLNDAADRAAIQVQQLNEQVDRSLKFPVSDAVSGVELPPAAQRVGKALVFDASGNVIVSTDNYVDQLANVTAQAGAASDSASASAGSAAASAGSAAASASSASTALSYLNDFKGRYYGVLTADPALDPLGAAPTAGDLYFNSISNAVKVYNAGVWAIVPGASPADLANSTDTAKGAALVGDKGTTVSNALALDKRKPRKLFSKLFASASAPTFLKTAILGDSLANMKTQQFMSSLDRRLGGTSTGGVNTSGTSAGASYTGGADLSPSGSVSVITESGMYQYWPTGSVFRFDAGGSASWIVGGVAPYFTTIKVYYVKEPGAGTINLVVGGATVATASANAAAELGVLSYTQAHAQATVSVNVTGAAVRVLMVHANSSAAYGADVYLGMGTGGLSLTNATSSAQGRAIWQAALSNIAPDFVTFEMDDNFGDGGANAAAFVLLSGILDAACPYADKLIIASTPRAADDAGKLASNNYLKGFCGAKDASYLFFDSYYLMGSYADMIAIFGADDGTHPVAAAQAYAAEIMWEFLGLNGFNLGYVPRAVNDRSTASTMKIGTKIYSGGDYLMITADGYGYEWDISFARTLTLKTRGAYGSVNGAIGWQFSGNTAVNPHVMPLGLDFNSAGNVRKLDTSTSSGIEFTRFRKTDNPGGYMHLNTGMIRSAFTRAELLAINANANLGAIAFCTDCTGGAQLVYARGGGPTDWVTVDGKTGI